MCHSAFHPCPHLSLFLCMCAKSLKLCLTLCELMDHSLPGPGILQERILEWVAMPSSRGSSQPRDQTPVFMSLALGGEFFITSVTWEAHPPLFRWSSQKLMATDLAFLFLFPLICCFKNPPLSFHFHRHHFNQSHYHPLTEKLKFSALVFLFHSCLSLSHENNFLKEKSDYVIFT